MKTKRYVVVFNPSSNWMTNHAIMYPTKGTCNHKGINWTIWDFEAKNDKEAWEIVLDNVQKYGIKHGKVMGKYHLPQCRGKAAKAGEPEVDLDSYKINRERRRQENQAQLDAFKNRCS